MVQENIFQQTQQDFQKTQQDAPPLSRAERNINNSMLEGIVKRLINDKEGSKNKYMFYVYYPNLLKEYKTILPWLNKKTME